MTSRLSPFLVNTMIRSKTTLGHVTLQFHSIDHVTLQKDHVTQHVTLQIYSVTCVQNDHVTPCKDHVTLQNDSVKISRRYQCSYAMTGARDLANS